MSHARGGRRNQAALRAPGRANTRVASRTGGGSDWEGTTCCVGGTTCTAQNAFYSQCVSPAARN